MNNPPPKRFCAGVKPAPFAEIQKMIQACMQCGSCSASCPNIMSMDITPRQIWRKVLLGRVEEVLNSRTYWLCSSCYTCTLRCPRGLPLTEAMQALKRLATHEKWPHAGSHSTFYVAFMDSVRKYSRVQETQMMMRYFWARKSPVLPLKYTPLGLKLMLKGKLHARPSKTSRGASLKSLFDSVRKMENEP